MFDAGKVGIGLAAFVVLASLPVTYNLLAGKATGEPNLSVGTNEKECVLPAAEMRATHMKLLEDWRDRVVRKDERVAHTFNGRSVRMSLTGTCLGCHSQKAEFCDRCHGYAAVELDCFGCHVEPAAAKLAVGLGSSTGQR
jgi:hypothetical protein